jgi:transcriptional regulator with AAA-type ATPase domain/polyferredoxin
MNNCDVKLDKELIDFLRPFGEEVSFPAGATLFRRGDEGNSFYVITSGQIEARVPNGEDQAPVLNRLAAGDFFGETSLLTEAPITADLISASPVDLLVCPRDSFFSAMADSKEFGTAVSKALTSRSFVSADTTLGRHGHLEALNTLMGASILAQPLFTLSPAMKPIENFVESQPREGDKAIMIYGGAGTGKSYLASFIHRTRLGRDAPFVVVDCRSFCCEEVGSILFGAPRGPTRLACEGASAAEGSFGALYLARGGTLVLKHIDALALALQNLLLDHLQNAETPEGSRPLNLIATTRKNPGELEGGGLLHPRLAEMLEGTTLRMPNLCDRRRDILPLAFYYLQRCEGHSPFTFAPDAERKLLSYDFTYRNATELKEAVETATQVTESVDVGAEHLFLGPTDMGPPQELEIARSPLFRLLTSRPVMTLGRYVVLLSFLAVAGTSLLGPGAPEGRLANALIWGLWEPLLFLSFFSLGRVWCTLCPLSTAGKLLARIIHLDRPPPNWLKRNSGLVLVAGFAAIIWAEHYFVMIGNPFPSGLLLLLLFAAAGLFAVWYQRETWCQYACPLGGLGAALGISAVLNVKANRHICANYCTTHECYKGTAIKPGCPSSRHPLQGVEAHTCKLCLSCIDNCPHGAARLYIRPPLAGVWQLSDIGQPMVIFGFFLFFFVPAMLASQGHSWFTTNTGFAFTTLAAILGAHIAQRLVPATLEGYRGSRSTLLSRITLALVVLAWGPAMAYQARHVPGLTSVVIHLQDNTSLASHPPEIPVLFVVQVLFIVLAAVLSSICFWRIRHNAYTFLHTPWDLGWNTLALACFLYVTLNIFLVLPLPK